MVDVELIHFCRLSCNEGMTCQVSPLTSIFKVLFMQYCRDLYFQTHSLKDIK